MADAGIKEEDFDIRGILLIPCFHKNSKFLIFAEKKKKCPS